MKPLLIFLSLFAHSLSTFGQEPISLNKLADACVAQQSQDSLCHVILDLRQIGNDSVEAIKQYIELGPYQYYSLTVLNALATSRIRIKSKSYLFKDGTQTIDLRPDSIIISIEVPF